MLPIVPCRNYNLINIRETPVKDQSDVLAYNYFFVGGGEALTRPRGF